MTGTDVLLVEHPSDDIVVLRLNRPQVRNALNLDVRGTYRHAVDSEIFGDATAQFDDPNALHSYNVSAGLGFEF